MAKQVEKPAAPLALQPPSMDKQDKGEDSAAALEQDQRITKMSPLLLLKQSNKVRSLVALVDQKVLMLLVAVFVPPLMPVSEVCCWTRFYSFHMLCWATIHVPPMLERRLRRLTPSQAAVAHVLPTAMLWCSLAGMAAAVLAPLLGSRRGRLGLAYAVLTTVSANLCFCAGIFGLMLVSDYTAGRMGMGFLVLFAGVSGTMLVFLAARDLVAFRSLRKAAAAEE